MYLPLESIAAWKSKIEKRPALISPKKVLLEQKSAVSHAQFFMPEFIKDDTEKDGLTMTKQTSNTFMVSEFEKRMDPT